MERMTTQQGSTFSGNNSANMINQIGNANNVNINGFIEDERKEFFRWLDFIDFRSDQTTILKKRYEHTGGWIVHREQFRDWFENPERRLLWCWGPPGIGKSVIASVVIDYLQRTCENQDGSIVAYVYFKHDARGDQNLSKILRSLVQQLCYKMDKIPTTAIELYRNCNQNRLVPSNTELIYLLQNLCGSYNRAFLVLDALDECDESYLQEILDFLTESVNTMGKASIFVTSRREAIIQQHLESVRIPFIPIEARDVGKDIETFVHGCVEKKIRERRLHIASEDLKAKVISELIMKAQGMFLWVTLQLERLCKQRRERDIESELTKLPPDLNGTYHRILKQINAQEDNLRDLCKKSLMWIFYATRPLETDELVHAVSVDEDCHSYKDLRERVWDFETIREACANLIKEEISYGRLVVRPIHFSVREYFTTSYTESPQSVSSYTSNASFAYNHLAKCCLTYLMIDSFQYQCSSYNELCDRIDTFPLSCHASYVFDQYILSTVHVTSELATCLQRFLKSKGQLLASTLQLRRLEDYMLFGMGYITEFDGPILPSDIIYSTALYGSKQLSSASSEWNDLKPPKLAFFHAIRASATNIIMMLLDKGHNITECDGDGSPPMCIVAQSGNIAIFHLLIRRGADVNAQGGHYGNALQAASYMGYKAIVNLLIHNGANVNAQGGFYGNALYAASYRNHKAVVSILFQNGADINAQGGYYGNALQVASARGYEAIVSLLIENGVNVNAQGGYHGNALQAASAGGYEATVRLLLENGANVNAQGGLHGNALQAASDGGNEAIVCLLLENGANVSAQGGYYGNALQAASYKGYEVVVSLLLKNGVNVNAQGGHNGNALQAASAGGYENIVGLLLQNGANVNAQGGHHGNALHSASGGGYEVVVSLLLQNGVNVNIQGGYYGNALQAASYRGHEAVVGLLLQNGANVNVQGGCCDNALQAASYMGHENIVGLLLQNGANINARGREYGNALQAACLSKHEVIVSLLLQDGADINSQGGYYGNALQAACFSGNEAIVNLLLQNGANTNAQGGHYGNALQAASSCRHEGIVSLLLQAGAKYPDSNNATSKRLF